MKRFLALAIILLAAACENPVTHFTEDPLKEKKVTTIHCPVDTLAEPMPPGMPADTACGGHRP